jgi:hypothetical protein
MRTAPAVHLSLEADTSWRVGLCLLGAAAAASPLMWLALWLLVPPLAALGVAAAVALLVAGLLWRRSGVSARALAWDGAQWWLLARDESAPRAGRVQLMIDLGAWLLLRFRAARGDARGHWLALSQARHRPHWHALRCALYAHGVAANAAAGVPGQDA